jgi:deaminated glutathione amidase
MRSTVRAGVVQMNAGLDKERNLAAAERLVRQAAAAGAEWIVLPELCAAYGPLDEVVPLAESIPGPSSDLFAALARELGVVLCAGSLCERSDDSMRGYNTSCLFDRDGRLAATYRKLHLFDVEIPGAVCTRESDHMRPGAELAATQLDGATFGQAICYDLRFPELFRALMRRGMEVLLLPSAFTAATGRDHWELLVRARAVENQCYVLAANQYGAHGAAAPSYGGSLMVDPWGRVLARAALDAEEVLIADLDGAWLAQVRERWPARRHVSAALSSLREG